MKWIWIFLIFVSLARAQDSPQVSKSNPILFFDLMGGFGGGGLVGGASLNFQVLRHLFTLRYSGTTDLDPLRVSLAAPGPAPDPAEIEVDERNSEFALLYGWRFVRDGRALSFSGGVSAGRHLEKLNYYDGFDIRNWSNTTGFAWEASIKWFKKEKRPYHVYLVVPVGNPVSFGHSFGFKLVGNVSKHTYAGIGITYGWGWHKQY